MVLCGKSDMVLCGSCVGERVWLDSYLPTTHAHCADWFALRVGSQLPTEQRMRWLCSALDRLIVVVALS